MSSIQNNQRISIQYKVIDQEGQVIDDTEEPVQYIQGQNQIFPALEAALLGREVGDSFSITLSAEEAYGEYNPDSVQRLSLASLEHIEDLEIGMTLFTGDEANSQAVKVLDIEAGEVTIDANHPLAGQALTFDVNVINIDG